MLTASAAIEERVEGLALGADDYLPKPFAMSELVARIRALGRRTMRARPKVLEWGDVWLDPARRRAGRGPAGAPAHEPRVRARSNNC